MEIRPGESVLSFDENGNVIIMSGSMRLANLREYDKVKQFLNQAAEKVEDHLILDIRNLNFLNSSGITTISMFVIQEKKLNRLVLKVVGSETVPWQGKSLYNFQKLWNRVEVTFK